MHNQSNQKQNEKKGGVSPLAAAVTGVIVGAGVAVAGAIAMADKSNQDKVKKTATDVKKQVSGYVKDVQDQVQDRKNQVEQKVTKLEAIAKDTSDKVKKI